MNRLHDCASDSLAADAEAAHGTAPADPLSDVLRTVRLTGALFFLNRNTAPWAIGVPVTQRFAGLIQPDAQQILSYHIVTEGRCWAALDSQPGRWLKAGDILLIPHGHAYVMASAPGVRSGEPEQTVLDFFRAMAAGELPSLVSYGEGAGEQAQFVCGFLGCDRLPFNPILDALPPLLHLPAAAEPDGDRLRYLIDFALAESRAMRPGSRCTLLRLSELMFVEVLRRYLSLAEPDRSGWIAGLAHPLVGRALVLLHRQPAREWTIESLAAAVGTSRSTLADRFSELMAQPPMQYLARWRMQLAARRLADGPAKIQAIAQEVGYDSEAAFSRAFKRIVGLAPAQWRRRSAHAMALG